MKLASYKDGSRDGQLLVVARDLGSAHYATGIATRLQQVLDDWNFLSPQLEALSQDLNHGKARHAFPFEPGRCAAPLPRAYLRARAEAPVSMDRAADRGPLLRILRSDALLGPRDLLPWPAHADCVAPELDFEGELAIVSGDIPAGASADAALDGVRLLMLAGGLHRRDAAPGNTVDGDAGYTLSPVAITPDELGPAWRGGQVHLSLHWQLNGKRFGSFDTASADTACHWGALLSTLARHAGLPAGCIVGIGSTAGTDGSHGNASISRRRARELAEHGEARTPYLQPGDTVRLDVQASDGHAVFGSIELAVAAAD